MRLLPYVKLETFMTVTDRLWANPYGYLKYIGQKIKSENSYFCRESFEIHECLNLGSSGVYEMLSLSLREGESLPIVTGTAFSILTGKFSYLRTPNSIGIVGRLDGIELDGNHRVADFLEWIKIKESKDCDRKLISAISMYELLKCQAEFDRDSKSIILN